MLFFIFYLGSHNQEYKNRQESVQHRAATFVCIARRLSGVSNMPGYLNWNILEDSWTISTLSLLYQSVHIIVAINIDEHYTKLVNGNFQTRKTLSIFITHPTASKKGYRYSSMPMTVVELNILNDTVCEASSIDTSKDSQCSTQLSTYYTRNS